ncbi:MAG TPA: sigma-70 family RNA polymerase sigma factor [bacterium]|nr:sigma-70 family RNA polymerase sigma factor [bacterium]HQQ01108.1 sigma-70 family RNA polymerase sigma factor [bacterium]
MSGGEQRNTEDLDLIRKTLSGHTESYRILVERHSGMIYSIAYGMTHHREEAQDAVQEIFYRAFRGLSGFRPEYPFGAWIKRIAINYLLDLRKKKRPVTVSLEDCGGDSAIHEISEDTPSARERLNERQREVSIRNAVAALPAKYRIVVVLKHFEEMSCEEIAESLGCPLGTVMTRLHRGRQKLAEALGPILEES